MLWLIVLASLAAAFMNASASLMQRIAAGKVEARELFRKSLTLRLLKRWLWLGGIALETLAFVGQAIALKRGSLVLVEPLFATDLIFLLLILYFKFRIKVGPREWLAVLGICAGLSALLVAANPRTGHLSFSDLGWSITGGVIGLVVIAGAIVMRRLRSSAWRAAIGGLAAAANFALAAALTKLTMQQLNYGIGHVFGDWQVYALAVVGIFSLITVQNVYAAGPLTTSQPIIELFDPLISVIIGIVLFGDIISVSAGALFFEVVGATMAATGIILLGSSKRIQQFSGN